jgi:hypothetical protein
MAGQAQERFMVQGAAYSSEVTLARKGPDGARKSGIARALLIAQGHRASGKREALCREYRGQPKKIETKKKSNVPEECFQHNGSKEVFNKTSRRHF